MPKEVTAQTRQVLTELLEVAKLEKGDILIVGCSTSEVAGQKIGTASNEQLAAAILEGLWDLLAGAGVHLAAQCCEHLNRSVIIEKQVAKAYGLAIVNALPQPKAGGSFATAVYEKLSEPVAVETVAAAAGIDIGDTLIGMHLRPVAIPVRVKEPAIGHAHVVCARTRPKLVGGVRAVYNENLL